jgi:hypothetical protein
MDVLATFPQVSVSGAQAPGKDPVSRATAVPRRSRSITILAVVALCTWTAAWLLERQQGAARQAATSAPTEAGDGESVTR